MVVEAVVVEVEDGVVVNGGDGVVRR